MPKKRFSLKILAIWLNVCLIFLAAVGIALSHDKTTSQGNNIEHEHKPAFTEKQQEAANAAKQATEKFFGDKIKQVAGPTRTYNCAGLVICKKTSWVSKLGVFEWLFDEGYRRLGKDEKAKVGDVVVYYKDKQLQHIGIVEEVDDKGNVIKVRSKWGEGGEFIHDPTAVPPAYGSPTVVTK